ncbi:MAG: hypothetical protein H0W08_25300 [Acidobacteria bacterium]|nr:hypothetical protein [Acidobacteriota bacterium]
MIPRPLAIGILAAGCLTAAAGGSYVAIRQNATAVPQPVSAPASLLPATPAVNESEGLVTPGEPVRPGPQVHERRPQMQEPRPQGQEAERVAVEPVPASRPVGRRVFPRNQPIRRAPERVRAEPSSNSPAQAAPTEAPGSVAAALPSGAVESARAADRAVGAETTIAADAPPRIAEPIFEEIVVPAASVIGLELESSVSSERAQLEDRVDARVTRDVYADGRLAIPAGSRVVGAVTLVERGGKVKERARLGVRFHTLVLATRQVALRTETIYREGESPSNESSRKIGGAAIGGAVLGAILGGGKGAIAGATAGAAGGTAAVMAGGRNAATLASGSIVTVKLAAPASLVVER